MANASPTRDRIGRYIAGLTAQERMFIALDRLGIFDAKFFRASSVPKLKYKRCKRIVQVLQPIYVEMKLAGTTAWYVQRLSEILEPVIARLKELEAP